MSRIHPTAIIDPQAEIAADVQIGPFSIIEGKVSIDSGCIIGAHVFIKGDTKIGKKNSFFQFSSIGEDCQDTKFDPKKIQSKLIIGDNNIFRENVTIHRGSLSENHTTLIRNNCIFMAGSHVAHDCIISDNVTVSVNAGLAGHVEIAEDVIIGGLCGIHQFCSVGRLTILGGGTITSKSIPAFVTVAGNHAKAYSLNFIGLRRKGFSDEAINNLKKAYRILYRLGNSHEDALTLIEQECDWDENLQEFIRSISNKERGIIKG